MLSGQQSIDLSIREIQEITSTLKNKVITLPTRSRKWEVSLDFSNEFLWRKYGLKFLERVESKEEGPGRVIGIEKAGSSQDRLWFLWDKDAGVSFWDGISSRADLTKANLKSIQDNEFIPSVLSTGLNKFRDISEADFTKKLEKAWEEGDYTQCESCMALTAKESPTLFVETLLALYNEDDDEKTQKTTSNQLFNLDDTRLRNFFRITSEIVLSDSFSQTYPTDLYFAIGSFIFRHPEAIAEKLPEAYLLALIYLTLAKDYPGAEILRAYCYLHLLKPKEEDRHDLFFSSAVDVLKGLTENNDANLLSLLNSIVENQLFFKLPLANKALINIKNECKLQRVKARWSTESAPEVIQILADLTKDENEFIIEQIEDFIQDKAFYEAQHHIANYYLRRGIYEKALFWLEKAINNADVPPPVASLELTAQGNRPEVGVYLAIAKLYANHKTVPIDYKSVIYCFQRAAEGGNLEAKTRLAILCYEGKGVPSKINRAVGLLEEAVLGGCELAIEQIKLLTQPSSAAKTIRTVWAKLQLILGELYQNGKYFPLDAKKAESCFKEAVAYGNDKAKWCLAKLYIQAWKQQWLDDKRCMKLPKNYPKIRALLTLAGVNRYAAEVEETLAEVRELVRCSATQHYPESMYHYGVLLCNKLLRTQENLQEGVAWIGKAAKRGFSPALTYLIFLAKSETSPLPEVELEIAKLYLDGTDEIEPKPQKALKWFMRAHQHGSKEAENYAHLFYEMVGDKESRIYFANHFGHCPALLAKFADEHSKGLLEKLLYGIALCRAGAKENKTETLVKGAFLILELFKEKDPFIASYASRYLETDKDIEFIPEIQFELNEAYEIRYNIVERKAYLPRFVDYLAARQSQSVEAKFWYGLALCENPEKDREKKLKGAYLILESSREQDGIISHYAQMYFKTDPIASFPEIQFELASTHRDRYFIFLANLRNAYFVKKLADEQAKNAEAKFWYGLALCYNPEEDRQKRLKGAYLIKEAAERNFEPAIDYLKMDNKIRFLPEIQFDLTNDYSMRLNIVSKNSNNNDFVKKLADEQTKNAEAKYWYGVALCSNPGKDRKKLLKGAYLIKEAAEKNFDPAAKYFDKNKEINALPEIQFERAKDYNTRFEIVIKNASIPLFLEKLNQEQNKNAEAKFWYGLALCKSNNEKQLKDAAKIIMESARQGYQHALTYLEGNPQVNSLPDVQFELARFYHHGGGSVQSSYVKAAEWYKKAVENSVKLINSSPLSELERKAKVLLLLQEEEYCFEAIKQRLPKNIFIEIAKHSAAAAKLLLSSKYSSLIDYKTWYEIVKQHKNDREFIKMICAPRTDKKSHLSATVSFFAPAKKLLELPEIRRQLSDNAFITKRNRVEKWLEEQIKRIKEDKRDLPSTTVKIGRLESCLEEVKQKNDINSLKNLMNNLERIVKISRGPRFMGKPETEKRFKELKAFINNDTPKVKLINNVLMIKTR